MYIAIKSELPDVNLYHSFYLLSRLKKNMAFMFGLIFTECCRFFASEQHRTGKPIPGDHLRDEIPLDLDMEKSLEDPFSFSEWIDQHRAEVNEKGKRKIFGDNSQFQVKILHYSTIASESSDINKILSRISLESKSNSQVLPLNVSFLDHICRSTCMVKEKTVMNAKKQKHSFGKW